MTNKWTSNYFTPKGFLEGMEGLSLFDILRENGIFYGVMRERADKSIWFAIEATTITNLLQPMRGIYD